MPDKQIIQNLKAHLETNLPHALDWLRRMVEINSFTANAEGVNRLGRLTAELFAGLGFTAVTVPARNPLYGKHLVLRRDGRTAQKIGLISHLDTVFPPDEERRNNFHWRVEGDRIYGPGTVDIKGGTIVIYMMMAALQAILPDVFNDAAWVILLNACEETGCEDFGELCLRELAGARGGLIFEGGAMRRDQFKIVAARKGMAIFRAQVEGKAAHAGSAHQRGANAIAQMADVIQRIHGLTDYGRDLTFNVGTIAGGTVINRVPHYASSTIEMRAFTPEVYEDGVAAMMALDGLSTVRSGDGRFACHTRVELLRRTPPWARNPATDALLAVWRQAAADLGYTVVPEERGGLSDGNHIWRSLPVIDGLGPSGGNSHCSERSEDGGKEQEYCLASSFAPKALLNVAGVARLLGLGN